MQWQNISILLRRLAPFIDKQGLNIYEKENMQCQAYICRLKQSGCIRTNCMDCLDRTNVI